MPTAVQGVSVEVWGLKEATAKVDGLPNAIATAIAQRLYRWCEGTMTLSKDAYVPVKDGILRGSGFVEQPVIEPGQVSCRMGFGGASADYAAKQHEDLDLHHPNGGQAKYLETPILLRGDELKADVAAGIKEAIAGTK